MKMLLTVRRFDKNWKLLETRQQLSRSWTLGLLQMLYCSHYQIVNGGPVPSYAATTVDRQTANIDLLGIAGEGYYTTHNRICGPAGFSPIEWPGKVAEAAGLVGCDIGIQVGNDNTAVTPTDRRLGHRIGHGRRAADGGDVTFETYIAGDNADLQVYDTQWGAQEFVPRVDFRCSSITLRVWKSGAPPADLTVEIRGAGADTDAVAPIWQPGDTVLATTTIAVADISAVTPGDIEVATFATPVDLYAGHRYFIVCHQIGGAAGNRYNWRYQSGGATYERAWQPASTLLARRQNSANSGATWGQTTQDMMMFTAVGRSQGEFEHGGTLVGNLVIADPNASMDITKFFVNNSGGAITVNEVGIQSFSWQAGNGGNGNQSQPILIARDVVGPGVAVADTEILLVTYTPQITV
ncbi:MAG: hypothetical protein PHI12_08170 [Dehalococcoidales bacterium]|nr:hypothetical protein [Dehalococcoidales bacterium]